MREAELAILFFFYFVSERENAERGKAFNVLEFRCVYLLNVAVPPLSLEPHSPCRRRVKANLAESVEDHPALPLPALGPQSGISGSKRK